MKKALMIVCLTVLVSFSLLGCNDKTQNKDQSSDKSSSQNQSSNKSPSRYSDPILRDPVVKAPADSPLDYLPMPIGTKLKYKITLGKVEPLSYKEVIWPRGKGGVSMATRGRFIAAMKKDDGTKQGTFLLELTVKGLAKKQGGLEYPLGFELTVDRDDLGVYKDFKQVFWAISTSGGFMCHEVVTYSPDTPGAPSGGQWGTWGTEDGYSMGVLFFGKKPGTQIGMGDDPKDLLLFAGIESVPDTSDSGLHFVRTVKPAEDRGSGDAGMLNSGFSENKYFVRGKGLVRLEQKIGGKTSMLWTKTD